MRAKRETFKHINVSFPYEWQSNMRKSSLFMSMNILTKRIDDPSSEHDNDLEMKTDYLFC